MPTDINRLSLLPPASNGLRKTNHPFLPVEREPFASPLSSWSVLYAWDESRGTSPKKRFPSNRVDLAPVVVVKTEVNTLSRVIISLCFLCSISPIQELCHRRWLLRPGRSMRG